MQRKGMNPPILFSIIFNICLINFPFKPINPNVFLSRVLQAFLFLGLYGTYTLVSLEDRNSSANTWTQLAYEGTQSLVGPITTLNSQVVISYL